MLASFHRLPVYMYEYIGSVFNQTSAYQYIRTWPTHIPRAWPSCAVELALVSDTIEELEQEITEAAELAACCQTKNST